MSGERDIIGGARSCGRVLGLVVPNLCKSKSSKGKTYLLDLYIPSYTPTLTTIIEAQATGGSGLVERKGPLAVVLLDESLGAASEEMGVLRRSDPMSAELLVVRPTNLFTSSGTAPRCLHFRPLLDVPRTRHLQAPRRALLLSVILATALRNLGGERERLLTRE